MRIHHLCRAALVGAMLLGACEGYKEDRAEETEMEREPGREATAFDSAAAGTDINTTPPLQPESATVLNAGRAGSDSLSGAATDSFNAKQR